MSLADVGNINISTLDSEVTVDITNAVVFSGFIANGAASGQRRPLKSYLPGPRFAPRSVSPVFSSVLGIKAKICSSILLLVAPLPPRLGAGMRITGVHTNTNAKQNGDVRSRHLPPVNIRIPPFASLQRPKKSITLLYYHSQQPSIPISHPTTPPTK